jgi:hypothetical protein
MITAIMYQDRACRFGNNQHQQVEFLKDVMQFVVSRGHGHLVHPSGSENFCEVTSNPAHMFFGDCKNCLNIGY